MASAKVAVVTGSNKGIGFAIVRGLCKSFQGDVFLTARDEGRGREAVAALNKEGLHPKFHQLDIDEHSSIQRLHNFLKENYGGIDILVNNAGIAYKQASTAPFAEQAEISMKTNFFGTLDVCETLFPLLRPHARVVNVSSMSSQFSLSKMSAARKAGVLGCKTIENLKKIMTDFVDAAKVGKHQQEGFSNSAYGSSKVGVTQMSVIQQANIDAQGKEDIVVNACCPGFVATDMSSFMGHLTIDQGAETPLYLALLSPNIKGPRGKFIREKQVADWK